MPRAVIKVGDKVKITADQIARESDYWTEGKEYEVERLNGKEPVVTNDKGGTGFLTSVMYTKVRAKAVPKDKAAVVKVPEGKITKDQIIGQDINKSILNVGITKNLPVLLIGETGTGKTSIIREQAKEQGFEITRFSITGETTVDEFVGKYELEKGQTVWKDGVLLDAMKKGKWLVCDEVNVALPEILFVLHSLLDDDRFVTVSNHQGEVVKPHKDFRFFATMNPPEEYAGTKELNKAFQSRFAIILTLHYPPAKVEAKIVADKTGVSLEDATKMADVAVALRKAKADEKIFYTCSTRDLLHWGELCDVLDPGEAFRVSILNKAGIESEAIYNIYSHIIKRYIQLEQPDVTLTVEWFEQEAQKIVAERKKFEAEKDETRKKITQEIIQKLTNGDSSLADKAQHAVDQVAEAAEAGAPSDNESLEDIFKADE